MSEAAVKRNADLPRVPALDRLDEEGDVTVPRDNAPEHVQAAAAKSKPAAKAK